MKLCNEHTYEILSDFAEYLKSCGMEMGSLHTHCYDNGDVQFEQFESEDMETLIAGYLNQPVCEHKGCIKRGSPHYFKDTDETRIFCENHFMEYCEMNHIEVLHSPQEEPLRCPFCGDNRIGYAVHEKGIDPAEDSELYCLYCNEIFERVDIPKLKIELVRDPCYLCTPNNAKDLQELKKLCKNYCLRGHPAPSKYAIKEFKKMKKIRGGK